MRLSLVPLVATLGCSGKETAEDTGPGTDTDDTVDTDTDTDTDSDADTDTDTDTDSDADTDTDSDTDTDTGTITTTLPATVLSASCTLQPDNVLRFDCAVTTDIPGPASVRVLDGAEEIATWPDTTRTANHDVTLWGLRAQTTYTFEAFSPDTPDTVISGQITTGALPADYDIDLTVTGGPSGADYVMFDWTCGGGASTEALLIASTDGHVLWYQNGSGIDPNADIFRAYSFSPEGTVLAILEHEWVAEWDLAGNLLTELSVGAGTLTNVAHHDIERRNGLTYVISARGVDYPDGNRYAMDGFDVLDSNGVIASFTTEGVLDPTLVGPNPSNYWGNLLGPDTSDWSHSNAIGIDAQNNVYMSMRFINSVLKVVGDPAAPDFGTPQWLLVGDGSNVPYAPDLTLTSTAGITPVDFQEQHHVSIDANGDLMMWDNRSSVINTRGLRIEVDEGTSTADIVESWDSGLRCPGQGSVFRLDNGNVLVDCASERVFAELESGTSQELWRMVPSCKTTTTTRSVYRAIPVSLYPTP